MHALTEFMSGNEDCEGSTAVILNDSFLKGITSKLVNYFKRHAGKLFLCSLLSNDKLRVNCTLIYVYVFVFVKICVIVVNTVTSTVSQVQGEVITVSQERYVSSCFCELSS